MDKIIKKLTNNYKDVPLFYVTFDLKKFENEGEKGSCTLGIHPSLKEDKFVAEQLKGLVDHIRKNYDMEKLVK